MDNSVNSKKVFPDEINIDFISQGTQLEESDNKLFFIKEDGEKHVYDKFSSLFLDTGNILTQGVIDHHQTGFEDLCSAYIVATEANNYLSHLRGGKEVTIYTHFVPDLDAALSTYLAIKFISGDSLNESHKQLAEYALDVDSGRYTFDLAYPISIASIITAIVTKVSNEKKGKHLTQDENIQILEESFRLFDKIVPLIEAGHNPWDYEFLDNITGFDDYIELIKYDRIKYSQDFKNSEISQFYLVNNETKTYESVDFICSENPESFLWKYWVRGDKINSPNGNGFIFTAKLIELETNGPDREKNRAIISVDPNMPYNLKGLGVLLDSLEINKILNDRTQSLDKSPRSGFHRDNPWFDGRGSHDHTIIDAPKEGSLLDFQEIKKAIYAIEYWQNIGVNFEDYKENFEKVRGITPPRDFKKIDFEVVSDFQNAKTSQSHEYLTKIEELCKDVFYSSPQDQYQRLEVAQNREQIFEKILEVYFDLPVINRESWAGMVSKILLDWMPFTFIQKWLKDVDNLEPELFWPLFEKATRYMSSEDLIPFLMQISGKHSRIGEKKKKLAQQQLRYKNISKSYFDTDDSNHVDRSSVIDYPIYYYRYFKHYLNDILYTTPTSERGEHDLDIAWFLKTSLEDFFSKEEISFKKLEGYRVKSENVLNGVIIKPVLGEQYSKLRSLRSNLLKELRDENILYVKRVSVSDIAKMTFNELSQLCESLSKITVQNDSLEEYIKLLQFLKNVLFFEFLESRMLYMLKIQVLVSGEEEVSRHLRSNNESIHRVLDILLSIWKAQYRYYFEAESFEFIDEINAFIADLKNLSSKSIPFANTSDFVEELYVFLTKVVEEQELPLDQLDAIVELCFKQHEEIKENRCFLTATEGSPKIINNLTVEIFSVFKRYYLEKVSFLQNDVQTVLEKDRITNNAKSFFEAFSEDILKVTVIHDWQEYKMEIFKKEDDQLSESFFQSYFFWYNACHWSREVPINEDQDISELESEIRFAARNTSSGMRKLVAKLPKPPKHISLHNQWDRLTKTADPLKGISHLPYSLYFNVYDHLTEKYLSKFDVDSVSNSLFKFTSKFPGYISWFSKTSNLRKSVLSLIALLLMVGVFDPSYYTVNGKLVQSPAARLGVTLLGESLFEGIYLVLKYFWITFMGIGFLTPIVFVTYNFLWAPIQRLINKSGDSDLSFSFLGILGKIETKSAKLLYLSLIVPLLLVVMQMSNPSTFSLLNNFEGLRMASAIIIVLMMTVYSLYLQVKESNPDKPEKWIFGRVNHMFWLHTLQALILSIFVIDVMLRAQVGISTFAGDSLFAGGIARSIRLEVPGFDVVIMPIFTIALTYLTMFVGFFVNRIFNR